MSPTTAELLRPCKRGAFYPRSPASTRGLSCRNNLRAPAPRQFPFIGVIGSKANVHLTKESFGSGEIGKVIVGGFVYVFVLAIRISVLLCGLVKAFERWTCRVQSCAVRGLIVAAFYDFVLSTIAGLVLAKFVTPKAEPTAA